MQSALRDGAGANAGLSAQDVIIAIDGLKASDKLLQKYAKQAGTYTVYAFRRDELMQFEVQGHENALSTVELKVENQDSINKWLKA